MGNSLLIKAVIIAFDNLTIKCHHTLDCNGFNDGDCHNPDMGYKNIPCLIHNCPLLVGVENDK